MKSDGTDRCATDADIIADRLRAYTEMDPTVRPMVFGEGADEFAALRDQGGHTTEDEPDREGAMAIAAVRSLEVLEPGEVAAVSLDALEAGRFLALPHGDVAAYEQARAADHDRWIRGMRRLQRSLSGE